MQKIGKTKLNTQNEPQEEATKKEKQEYNTIYKVCMTSKTKEASKKRTTIKQK